MDVFTGFIAAFGFSYSPRGWIKCDGQLLAISQNQSLYSLLGTTYGGDGRTIYGIPDLRGRTPVGDGTAPGIGNFDLGKRGGNVATILQSDQMPEHTHIATVGNSGGSTVTGTLSASTENGAHEQPEEGDFLATSYKGRGDVNSNYAPVGPDNNFVNLGGLNLAVDLGAISVTNANAGGGNPIDTMSPYLVIHYSMAALGIYPPRN
ncbi:MAG: tail fiber protein [Rhodospirillales bacterium]|nr:tail fiber protein [Rhodospirillales bacterium]